MITKNAAVVAILAEALKSLNIRAKANKLQAGDVELLESIWRCSFTSHTKYDRDMVTQFATAINYGGEPPKMHKDDDEEQYKFVTANAAKWIAKWNICPDITAKLVTAAAEAKAKEEAAKAAEAAKVTAATAEAQPEATETEATA